MELICNNCNKSFCKKNYEYRKTVQKTKLKNNRIPKHYCTKKCALDFINIPGNSYKRPRTKKCGNCDCNNLVTCRYKYCSKQCRPGIKLNLSINNNIKRKVSSIDDLTLAEAAYADKAYNKHTRVRTRAQQLYRHQLSISPCSVCNYKLHTEICHIKSISSFPSATLVKTVNDPSNISYLCRNCHWEFDHGILNITQIKSILDIVPVAGTAPA